MAIVKWEPQTEMTPVRSLRDEVDRLFDDFLQSFGGTGLGRRRQGMLSPFAWDLQGGQPGQFVPNVDLSETDEAYMLSAEMPGMTKEMVDIAVTEDSVTLKGERKEESERKEENFYCREASFGKFERTVQLPGHIRADKVEAQMRDGMLTMKMPKSEPASGKTVKIKVK